MRWPDVFSVFLLLTLSVFFGMTVKRGITSYQLPVSSLYLFFYFASSPATCLLSLSVYPQTCNLHLLSSTRHINVFSWSNLDFFLFLFSLLLSPALFYTSHGSHLALAFSIFFSVCFHLCTCCWAHCVFIQHRHL